MRKVELVRGNRVVMVDHRLAPLLEKHSGYLRRDMVAQQPAVPSAEEVAAEAARKAPEVAAKRQAKAAAKKAATKNAGPKKDAAE